MSEEIKEILELKKRKIENSEAFGLTSINIQEDKLLLDYIINLQEENKELKSLCNEYEKEHITVFKQWKKDMKILNEYELWLKDLGAWVYLDKLKELKEKK